MTKKKYTPKITSFNMIGSWGLTEDKSGSDPSNVHTTVTKISKDKYRIYGKKDWFAMKIENQLLFGSKVQNPKSKMVETFIIENINVQVMITERAWEVPRFGTKEVERLGR